MRDKLIGILREMERRIPPPPNCHHALTYAQYGSGEAGWKNRLALQVNCEGRFSCFFLDDGDFEKDPQILSLEIAVMLANSHPERQFGVAFGQYISQEEKA